MSERNIKELGEKRNKFMYLGVCLFVCLLQYLYPAFPKVAHFWNIFGEAQLFLY